MSITQQNPRITHAARHGAPFARRVRVAPGFGLLGAIAMLGACTEQGMDALPFTVDEAGNVIVAAGDVITIDEDFTLRSDGSIVIDGEIRAEGDRGQRIVIQARGDIVVSGGLFAGDAGSVPVAPARTIRHSRLDGVSFEPGDGGDVVLESSEGSIILMQSARMSAGNGGDTTELNPEKAAGRGGDIVLSALSGSVQFDVAAQSLRLGNGGTARNLEIDADTIDPASPITTGNVGGRSGMPFVDTPSVGGLGGRAFTLEDDLFDTVRGDLIGAAGQTITVFEIDPETGPFSGGAAGTSGDVSVEPGKGISAARLKPDLRRFMDNGSTFDVDIEAEKGADGWFSTTGGSSANAAGAAGAEPGANGASVHVSAGNGGDCGLVGKVATAFTSVGCTGGRGGNASAIGGNGADGADPSQNGGSGGTALARAGLGGTQSQLIFSSDIIVRGQVGNATAVGGNGGNGGQACDPRVPDAFAGLGGFGGNASAGANPTVSEVTGTGQFSAMGGNGGMGGDAPTNPGNGGDGGEAEANELDFTFRVGTVIARVDGLSGPSGKICPPEDDPTDDPMDDPMDDPDPDVTELVNMEVTPEFGDSTSLAESCEVFGDGMGDEPLINSKDFVIPEGATKIRITVTSSNPNSRVNVFANTDNGPGFSACGNNQTTNTTVLEFMVTETGDAFVAIADTVVVGDSYTIVVEVIE
jgi:hypothetical protein